MKNLFKKILVGIMSFAMTLSIVACGGGEKPADYMAALKRVETEVVISDMRMTKQIVYKDVVAGEVKEKLTTIEWNKNSYHYLEETKVFSETTEAVVDPSKTVEKIFISSSESEKIESTNEKNKFYLDTLYTYVFDEVARYDTIAIRTDSSKVVESLIKIENEKLYEEFKLPTEKDILTSASQKNNTSWKVVYKIDGNIWTVKISTVKVPFITNGRYHLSSISIDYPDRTENYNWYEGDSVIKAPKAEGGIALNEVAEPFGWYLEIPVEVPEEVVESAE